jgi:hypothetical protein
MIESMPIHPEVQVFILVYMRLSVVFKVLLICTLYSNLVSILYIESIPHVTVLLYIMYANSMYHGSTLFRRIAY